MSLEKDQKSANKAGFALVRISDLKALAAVDFGRSGWSDRAELAARVIRDGLATFCASHSEECE